MLPVEEKRFQKLLEEWERDASLMRGYGAEQAAAAVTACSRQLTAALQELERETAYLNTSDYAAMHRVTPQSVRAWIRRGELTAITTASGDYMIPRSAVRRRRPRSRGASAAAG